MRKVLIVGGNGFVGHTLARSLKDKFAVTCTHQGVYTPIPGIEFVRLANLGDKTVCKAIVQKIEPEIVAYCAGSNDLLAAEQNVQRTQLVHSAGVTNVFSASENYKAKFIYISTNFVFSGVDGNYSESSTAIPAFQLGKAKLGAENFLRSRSTNYIIFRAAPLLGRGTLEHPSFVDVIREASLRKRKIKLQNKIIHNPVHIDALVDAVKHVIGIDVRNKIIHVGGLTKTSQSDLGKAVVAQLGLDAATIEVSDASSNAIPSDYSLNFTESLRVLEAQPLLLEQSIRLLT
ncbi:MAG: sugar nucleotide-binding protein [Bdellovibrionales bacterium]|nr:sugar nucleotide-binding protein [Bdellovibrionales bacterium]